VENRSLTPRKSEELLEGIVVGRSTWRTVRHATRRQTSSHTFFTGAIDLLH
jgi:hypothetical protein